MKTSKAILLIVGLGLCNLFFAGCAFSDGNSATDMKTGKMEKTMTTEGTNMATPAVGSMKPSGNTGMEKPMTVDMAEPMKEGMEKPMQGDTKKMK